MMNATEKLVSVDVMCYATGDSLGKIKVTSDYWQQYGDCCHPAYEWPNGVARAGDVLNDETIERLGISPEKTIWLD